MKLFSFRFLAYPFVLLACLQTSPAFARIDTLRTFPEKRFANGIMNFGHYMMKNLRYPLEAHQAATVGTSLVAFTITPTGKLIDITIVNSLGKSIDGEVRRLIESTKKMWMPADPSASQDSITMFLPVSFTLDDRSGANTFYVEPVKPDFILLNEIIVVGYSSQTTYGLHDDAYYINELSAALPKKDYKRMLKMVNELIRRNPYSDKLYLQRANIERELGQTDAACRDYKMIICFLGRTSFPKKFLQNCL